MSKDLTYRFDEIMTAVALTPSEPTDDDRENGLLLPNLTRDLHEPELFTAILCQTFKSQEADEEGEWGAKMCSLLLNSAMENHLKYDKTTEDDLYAVALAINISWAFGAGDFLFRAMGIMGAMANQAGLPIPEMATVILKGNDNATNFGKLDPYRILSKGYDDPMDMVRVTHPDLPAEHMDKLNELLRNMRGDKE